FFADIKGGNGDVLTYTSLAAGVDANIRNRRTEVQVSLRYEHQFGWNKNTPDQDVISGIASARVDVIRDKLNIEGGALATRVRADGLSGANNSLASSGGATSNVYSAYVGPTLTTHIGEMSVNAAYRLGYSRVEDKVSVTAPGVAAQDSFSDSVYQSATASVGMQPGNLPFGWSLGVGYDREDASQLDQRYEDKWVRADVTLPVSRTLAVVGGVGYEAIKISERDALRDSGGFPVVGSDGRFVTDKSSPRLLAYDNDGIIWDAGVLWRPSRRTSLEARVGRRYNSIHYVGSFSWQATSHSSFSLVYFDTIDSFGRALTGNLVALPSGFQAARNPFSGDLTGCVQGSQGGGQCFNDSLSGITTANYRHRGLAAQYSTRAGRWNWGAGLGYSQRKFLAPNAAIFASINGKKDENYYADLFLGRSFEDNSGLEGSLYANYFNGNLSGTDVTNWGSYVTYHKTIGNRLSAQASLGLDAVDPQELNEIITALGQIGLRYQF
ncbi:MAG: hypothetical protein ABI395_10020, partial [Sphingobium sp.]